MRHTGQPGGLYSRSNTPKLSLAQGPSSFLQDTQPQSGQKIIIFFPHFQVINSNNFLSGSSLLPSRLKRVSCKVWLTSLSSGRQKTPRQKGRGMTEPQNTQNSASSWNFSGCRFLAYKLAEGRFPQKEPLEEICQMWRMTHTKILS